MELLVEFSLSLVLPALRMLSLCGITLRPLL
jgi:hypothetical protein